MGRIIYLCPADNIPTGGIKVIYRHVELLRELGADAYILHLHDPNFRCSWFEHSVRFLEDSVLYCQTDLVVVPELWVGEVAPLLLQMPIRYAIFVQNGYITHPLFPDQNPDALISGYQGAAFILAISDDTARMVALNYPKLDASRILRVRYSVNERFFADRSGYALQAQGGRITYMPRKMGDHARRIVFVLRQHLPPHWQVVPIDNVDEATCVEMLHDSRIFLAFSEFEGLPVPPVEAALAGNLVIGYTGQGGREYWAAPNFQEIQQGDIIGFANAVFRAVEAMDAGGFGPAVLRPGMDRLAERFSVAAEREDLRPVLTQIAQCFENAAPVLAVA